MADNWTNDLADDQADDQADDLADELAVEAAAPVESSAHGALRAADGRSDLNAFISLAPELASTAGSLSGWTVGVKDLIDVAGLPTTAGAARAKVAQRDATVVRRLRDAGVAVLGKTNMDEWGLGVTGRNATWGDCRNPWDEARIAGGSSSGSAAAVAAGLVKVALGTDTAGSLRIPAAFCGVTALKPGRGVVPMEGVLGLAPSLDTVGALARTVADCAQAHALIAMPASSGARRQPRGRVGIPRGAHWATVEDDVAAAIDATARVLEKSGQTLVDLDVPAIGDATRLNGVVLLYEAAHSHGSRWPADRSSLDPRVTRQLELGAEISRAEYSSALTFRERWRATLADVFNDVDGLLHATVTSVAPRNDEHPRTAGLTHLTAAWSLAGLPVLAFQAGIGRAGMPVGASLVGPDGAEAVLLDLGMAFQRQTDWHLRRPTTTSQPSDGGVP